MHERRQVLIYPGESGFWVVECPSLPGCISQGQTKAEALDNIREAIDLYIESLQEDGMAVPEDRFQAEVRARLHCRVAQGGILGTSAALKPHYPRTRTLT